jgi:hypothetical protein
VVQALFNLSTLVTSIAITFVPVLNVPALRCHCPPAMSLTLRSVIDLGQFH